MNDTAVLPKSIEIFDSERPYVDSDLDLVYIDEAADDAAAILAARGVAEVAYQPGDGTRYNLVLVPLLLLEYARPRVKDGRDWGRHAVSGVDYNQRGFLVCLVDGPCYPLRLGDRGVLAADYVEEHWKLPPVSAVSVALLLRAISFHLDEVTSRQTVYPAPPIKEA